MKSARPRRAIYLDATFAERDLAQRRRAGLDRWDEVWEGDLHMSPPPSVEHGRIEAEFTMFVGPIVKEGKLGLFLKAGVREPGSGDDNYRVPDLVFISNERASIIGGAWLDGGPDVVFEIRSPGDETFEKLPFYAARGVREVVVIDRDTKAVELFRPVGSQMLPVSAATDGSFFCASLGIALRRIVGADGRGVLEVFLGREPARRVEI